METGALIKEANCIHEGHRFLLNEKTENGGI